MKTLLIHPKDETTDFLEITYKTQPSYILKDWTIIRDNIGKGKMFQLLKEHDRIIMMGHGTPKGLMGFNRYMIEGRHVFLLREKQELWSIWCYASDFMKKHKLTGFSTGMFISEKDEAIMLDIEGTEEEINQSNELFAKILSINMNDRHKLYESLMKNYNGGNIVDYNKGLIENFN